MTNTNDWEEKELGREKTEVYGKVSILCDGYPRSQDLE